MARLFAIFAIGLGLGGGFGFLAAALEGATLGGHDHAAHGHEATTAAGQAHQHDALVDVPATNAPELAVRLIEDPAAGWNMQVITKNFRFSPENAGSAHVAHEGHAHVYVNGIKIARLYCPWMHIGSLPENAEVEVTLNSNDHRTLSVGGRAISAAILVPATN